MATPAIIRGIREQLIENLRNDVLSGLYKEGDAIRQEEVVARYKVSRTPVREALIQLESEGLLTLVPNCGARVSAQAPDYIHELLIPMRRIIEVYALRLAFDSLDDEDFARWDSILEEMRIACSKNDMASVCQADMAFHRSIIEVANEPSLSRIWAMIVSQVRVHFLKSYGDYADLLDLYREHAAIVAVIREGDKQKAADFLASRIGDPDQVKSLEDFYLAQSGKGKSKGRGKG